MNNNVSFKKANLISSLDIFGYSPSLYINKRTKFKSNLGGVFTIVTIILSILAFIGFGIDIILKEKPISLFTKDVIDTPKIRKENIKLYVAPHFSPNLGKGPKIKQIDRKLQFILVESINKGVDIKTNFYDLIKCDETEDFKINLNNVLNYTLLPSDYYYCMPNVESDIIGKFGSSNSAWYEISIKKCQNTTTKTDCLPENEIDLDLEVFVVQFLIMNTFVDIRNYKNPIKNIITSDIMINSAYSSRRDIFIYKNVDVNIDYGWILEDISKDESFQIDSNSGIVYKSDKYSIHSIILSMNNLKDIYKIRYIKIQEIMANVGGFIKSCMLILGFLNMYFIEFLFYSENYNYFLNKYEKYSNNKLKNELLNNNFLNISTSSKTLIRKTPINIKLNIKEHIFKFLLCKNKLYSSKKKILKIVDLYIKSKLDYLNIIKLSEKVKYLSNTIYDKNKKLENKFKFYLTIVNKLSNVEEDDYKNINYDHDVNVIKLDENKNQKLDNSEII